MRKRIKIRLLRWLLADEINQAAEMRAESYERLRGNRKNQNAQTAYLLRDRVYIELLRITDQL